MSAALALAPQPQPDPARLRDFLGALGALVDAAGADEARIVADGAGLLAALVAQDDWLAEDYAAPDPVRYRQYLLHCDARERFSVVSFVWGPGQTTPIHDHRVWGLVGVLRGAERVETFGPDLAPTGVERLAAGQVEAFGPALGDIHRVSNAHDDRVSISIHVYGGNIGAVERATYDDADGRARPFISGYANPVLPNLWDRSRG